MSAICRLSTTETGRQGSVENNTGKQVLKQYLKCQCRTKSTGQSMYRASVVVECQIPQLQQHVGTRQAPCERRQQPPQPYEHTSVLQTTLTLRHRPPPAHTHICTADDSNTVSPPSTCTHTRSLHQRSVFGHLIARYLVCKHGSHVTDIEKATTVTLQHD